MRLKKIALISVGIFIALAALVLLGSRLLVRPFSLKVQKKLESFLPNRQVGYLSHISLTDQYYLFVD